MSAVEWGPKNFCAHFRSLCSSLMFAGGAFGLMFLVIAVWVSGMVFAPYLLLKLLGALLEVSVVRITPLRMLGLSFALSSLWCALRSLVPPARPRRPRASSSADPKLAALVDSVADELRRAGVHVERFDLVRVPLAPRVHTQRVDGRRELSLGRSVLALLDEAELRGVIAHEYAHHEAHRMPLTRLAWHISGSLLQLHENTNNPRRVLSRWSLSGSWFSPWRWLPSFVRWRSVLGLRRVLSPHLPGSRVQVMAIEFLAEGLGRCVRVVTAPIERLSRALVSALSHQIEHSCDEAAVRVTAAETYARALEKVTRIGVAWHIYTTHYLSGDEVELEAFHDFVRSGMVAELGGELEAWRRASSEWHPSMNARLARIGAKPLDPGVGLEWRDLDASYTRSKDEHISARVHAWHAGLGRRALELMHAERELFDLDMCARDLLLACSIIIVLVPWQARMRCSLRGLAGPDRLSGTVLVCLSRMISLGLVGAYTTTARQKQLLLCPAAQRPRVAVSTLLGVWSSVPKVSARVRGPEAGVAETGCALAPQSIELTSAAALLRAWEYERDLLRRYLAAKREADEREHEHL